MLPAHSTLFNSILEELEETRRKFLHLINEIPDKDWDRRFSGEGWTIKQEMVHIVQALQVIPAGIRRASAGSGHSLLAIVPTSLRGWVNGRIIIPLISKKATRDSIADQYTKARTVLVELLESLPEESWRKGMPYPKKYRTVEQMAHRPTEHFEEHLIHIRNVLGINVDDI